MYEYERQMKYYSVRDADNHMMLFYDSVREFSESEEIVQTAIADALGRFIREGTEAKNSQGWFLDRTRPSCPASRRLPKPLPRRSRPSQSNPLVPPTAIEHALTVLNWLENLPKKEVPPVHIWTDSEGLEQWWKRLEDLRSEGNDTSGSSSGSDDAGTDNDLARAFKPRALTGPEDD